MTKNKLKNRGMGTLLGYLDSQIEMFKKTKEDYPNLILMNKETKDKLFTELELEPIMDSCWKDLKNNYRGIPIEIRDVDFLKLE